MELGLNGLVLGELGTNRLDLDGLGLGELVLDGHDLSGLDLDGINRLVLLLNRSRETFCPKHPEGERMHLVR